MKNIHLAFLLLLFAACGGIEEDVVPTNEIIALKIFDADNLEIATTLNTTLVGDGETLIYLSAKIPHNTKEEWREVSLSTTEGEFLETGNKNYEERVNTEGYLEATIKLPLQAGEMIITAEVTAASTYRDRKTINLIRPLEEEVLSFEILSADGSSLPAATYADGETLVQLKAKVLVDVADIGKVTFTNTAGILQGGSAEIELNAAREAFVHLKMPTKLGVIYLGATVGSSPVFEIKEPFEPTHAYPDNIYLEPEKLQMALGEANTINIFLVRDQGKVTEGQTATYDTYQLDGNNRIPAGRLTGEQLAKSDTSGMLSVKYHADTNNIDTLKSVFIEVSTLGSNGIDSISNEIEIAVSP